MILRCKYLINFKYIKYIKLNISNQIIKYIWLEKITIMNNVAFDKILNYN